MYKSEWREESYRNQLHSLNHDKHFAKVQSNKYGLRLQSIE